MGTFLANTATRMQRAICRYCSHNRRRKKKRKKDIEAEEAEIEEDLAKAIDLTSFESGHKIRRKKNNRKNYGLSAEMEIKCAQCRRDQIQCAKMGHHYLILEKRKMMLSHRSGRFPIWLCFLLPLTYILLGSIMFSITQNWNFVDSLFFCFALIATIGMSEWPRQDNIDNFSRDTPSYEEEVNVSFVLICFLYLLLGLALLATCFHLMTFERTKKTSSYSSETYSPSSVLDEDELGS